MPHALAGHFVDPDQICKMLSDGMKFDGTYNYSFNELRESKYIILDDKKERLLQTNENRNGRGSMNVLRLQKDI